jgi:hypothetical protein
MVVVNKKLDPLLYFSPTYFRFNTRDKLVRIERRLYSVEIEIHTYNAF